MTQVNYVGAPSAFDLIFVSYLLAYLTLLSCLAVLLYEEGVRGINVNGALAITVKPPFARLALAGIFSALAGLPPFFFFLNKLGVLAALATSGAWGALASLVALLLIAWYAYQALITRAFLSGVNDNPLLHQKSRQVLFGWLVLQTCVALASFGGFLLFDDFILLCMWVSW